MKKLVVSLAVLGLVGVSPAHAHNQTKVKCSAKILNVENIPANEWSGAYRAVTVKTHFTNNTGRNLHPSMDLVFFDSPDFEDDVTLKDVHGHQPGKVKAGTTKTETGIFNVSGLDTLDGLRVKNCHRSWRS